MMSFLLTTLLACAVTRSGLLHAAGEGEGVSMTVYDGASRLPMALDDARAERAKVHAERAKVDAERAKVDALHEEVRRFAVVAASLALRSGTHLRCVLACA